MTIEEFEAAVEEIERVTVIIRGPVGEDIGDYHYERAIPGNRSITDWKRSRLNDLIGGYEYIILDGALQVPHGRTLMATIRESYNRD